MHWIRKPYEMTKQLVEDSDHVVIRMNRSSFIARPKKLNTAFVVLPHKIGRINIYLPSADLWPEGSVVDVIIPVGCTAHILDQYGIHTGIVFDRPKDMLRIERNQEEYDFCLMTITDSDDVKEGEEIMKELTA